MAAPPNDAFLGFALAEQALNGERPIDPTSGAHGDSDVQHRTATQFVQFAVGDLDDRSLERVHMLLRLMEVTAHMPISTYKGCVERMLQHEEVIGRDGSVMQAGAPPKPLPALQPNRRLDVMKNCWVQPVKEDSPRTRAPERPPPFEPSPSAEQAAKRQKTEAAAEAEAAFEAEQEAALAAQAAAESDEESDEDGDPATSMPPGQVAAVNAWFDKEGEKLRAQCDAFVAQRKAAGQWPAIPPLRPAGEAEAEAEALIQAQAPPVEARNMGFEPPRRGWFVDPIRSDLRADGRVQQGPLVPPPAAALPGKSILKRVPIRPQTDGCHAAHA